MGCNCGGSTPPAERKLASPKAAKAATAKPRRTGGPGQPGYAWNGPPRPDAK